LEAALNMTKFNSVRTSDNNGGRFVGDRCGILDRKQEHERWLRRSNEEILQADIAQRQSISILCSARNSIPPTRYNFQFEIYNDKSRLESICIICRRSNPRCDNTRGVS
jgi:hypothetical protein